MRTHGFVSRPDRHRSNLAGIYLFVNGRPVRDRVLQHALVDCYRDVLPRGRFPSAVLFVDLPLEAVDVNVHPAKWEVRFADPRAAHRWCADAVRSGARGPALARAARRAPTPCASSTERARAAPQPRAAAPRPTGCSRRARAAREPARRLRRERADDARVRFGELRLLGQLLATYLLVEGKQDLLLVDQHAAHERVLYEQLRAAWLAHGVERQALLAPLAVQLEPRALAVLAERADDAARLGFEVEPFGDDTLAVRTVPALLAGRDPAGARARARGRGLARGGRRRARLRRARARRRRPQLRDARLPRGAAQGRSARPARAARAARRARRDSVGADLPARAPGGRCRSRTPRSSAASAGARRPAARLGCDVRPPTPGPPARRRRDRADRERQDAARDRARAALRRRDRERRLDAGVPLHGHRHREADRRPSARACRTT